MKKVTLGASVLGLMFSANATALENAEISTKKFSSVRAGVSMGENFQTNQVVEGEEKNRFMGNFVIGAIGARKRPSINAYQGVEFLGDFSKSITKKFEKNDGLKTKSKASVGGLIPSLSVRLEYVFNKDILKYEKMGVSPKSAAVEIADFKDSKREDSFVLEDGVEDVTQAGFSQETSSPDIKTETFESNFDATSYMVAPSFSRSNSVYFFDFSPRPIKMTWLILSEQETKELVLNKQPQKSNFFTFEEMFRSASNSIAFEDKLPSEYTPTTIELFSETSSENLISCITITNSYFEHKYESTRGLNSSQQKSDLRLHQKSESNLFYTKSKGN